jgi:hypothetical protein
MCRKEAIMETSFSTNRELLISWIEGYTGTLQSVPFHMISTEDLVKIYNAIKTDWT